MTFRPGTAKAIKKNAKTASTQRPLKLESAHWGMPPKGALWFSIARLLERGTETLGVAAEAGVVVKRWKLEQLSIDWVRNTWGAGTYQVAWMGADPEGRAVAIGRGRRVEILSKRGEPARTKGIARPASSLAYESLEPQRRTNGSALHSPQGQEEVSRVVQLERDIAERRVQAERDISNERAKLERERGELERDRIRSELKQQITKDLRAEFGTLERDDDDAPEPNPWGPIAAMLGQLLKEAMPAVSVLLKGVASKAAK